MYSPSSYREQISALSERSMRHGASSITCWITRNLHNEELFAFIDRRTILVRIFLAIYRKEFPYALDTWCGWRTYSLTGRNLLPARHQYPTRQHYDGRSQMG